MSNLFDPASLRVAGLTTVDPSDEDRAHAAILAGVVREPTKGATLQIVARPEKKLKAGIDPAEMKKLASQPIKGLASKLASLSAATKVDHSKKTKGVKRPRVEEREAAKVASVDLNKVAEGGAPASKAEGRAESQPADMGAEIELVTVADEEVVAEEVPLAVAKPAPRRQSSEEVVDPAAKAVGSKRRKLAGESYGRPPYLLSEIDPEEWDRIKSRLVGDLEDDLSGIAPPAEEVFVPNVPLHRESSVLLSEASIAHATEQFTLPRDLSLMRQVPTVGVHMALKSYLVRGALLEQEIFNRLDAHQVAAASLEKEVIAERIARSKVEQQVSTLENDKKRLEGRHRRELEMRDDELKNLKLHRSKQSASIEKLRGEVRGLEAELAEARKRSKYLSEEVASEKRAREVAQEEAHSLRTSLASLKRDYEATQSDYQAARGDADLARGRVEYLESDEGKLEAVEAYRHTPEGKLEVALAVKAGFDFLASRLPEEVRPKEDEAYPLSVYKSLHVLRSLAAQGVEIPLESVGAEDEDEDDEEGEAAAQPAAAGDAPPASS